jgi:hypothetical protein
MNSLVDLLRELPLSTEEIAKLSALNARTPLELLSMRKASPAAFDSYVGSDRADQIAGMLLGLLTEGERNSLQKPVVRPGYLGARLDLESDKKS